MAERGDEYAEALGRRIRAARTERRMKQIDLADKAGLTRSSIANAEAGRQNLPAWTLAVLAKALGTTVCALLGEHSDAALAERVRIVAEIRRLADDFRASAVTRNSGLALGALVDDVADRINTLEAP